MKLSKEFEEELLDFVKKATTNNPESSTSNANQKKGGKQKKEPVEKALYRIATENRNLYFDLNSNAYVEIEDVKLGTAINKYLAKVYSEEFTSWTSHEFFMSYNKFPTNAQLEGLKRIITREAILNGQQIELFNRIASVGGAIYIDLGNVDRKMVKVDHTGWDIGNFSVPFQRYPHMQELPNPVKGGDIKELLTFFPPLLKHQQCLILCWLIASFIEGVERPFLLLEGLSGSGKTTLSNLLKSLIDPMEDGALSYNDNENEVAQIIDHQFIPLFDNLTTISRKLSNMFCRAYSGGSHMKKQLYTDDKDFKLKLSGSAIFNAIKLLKPKADFLDRCYKVEIDKTDISSRSKEQFEKAFDKAKPRIFGAILDVLSATLKHVQHIPVVNRYRTVDFDRYATAAAIVMGYREEEFQEARAHCEKIKRNSITGATPIIEALNHFLKANNLYYSGYMKSLVQQLPQYTDSPDEIPKQTQVLSRRIGEIEPELKAAGITANRKYNDSRGALWEFTLAEQGEPAFLNDEQQQQELPESSPEEKVDNTNVPEEPELKPFPKDFNPFTDEALDEISSQVQGSGDKDDVPDSAVQDMLKGILK